MSYKLKFLPSALKEWKKLSPAIKEQFRKKLNERQFNLKISSARLHDYKNIYKIKLRDAGYRLVYEVIECEVVIYVIAVGKRDKDSVYKTMNSRLNKKKMN